MNRKFTSALLAALTLPLMPISAGASEWKTLRAVYEVPVGPDLAKYAQFALADLRTREENGKTEFIYTLPLELTGKTTSVHVVETENGEFKGNISVMKCASEVCDVNYPAYQFNPDEVRAFLIGKGMSGEELGLRMQVFERFSSGEPAGQIKISPQCQQVPLLD